MEIKEKQSMLLVQKLKKSWSTRGSRKTLLAICRKVVHFSSVNLRSFFQIFAKRKFYKNFSIKWGEDITLFPPDYLDLNNLAAQIVKLKPHHVLELGGGRSTFVILSALCELEKKGHKFTFTSIDQDAFYLQQTIQTIPEQLRNKVTFLSSPLKIEEVNGSFVSFYTKIPDKPYDFVYEDRCDHIEFPIAGDIFRLEHKAVLEDRKFSFVLDGMTATRIFLIKNLKRNYSISGSFLHGTNFESNDT